MAWSFALRHPEKTERLVILNCPHPLGFGREFATNKEQRKNSAYAREFQKPDAASKLTAEGLAGWVKDPAARARYVEAFRRSDFEAMLNYYKANYPRASETEAAPAPAKVFPKIKCPVLMFHGLKDKYLLAAGLNGTWDWIGNELTIVTIPAADHFVQQDAADLVTERMAGWLAGTK